MKWGIITLTKGGIKRGNLVKRHLSEANIYTLPKYMEKGILPIEGGFSDFVGQALKDHDMLLFIMATGIVVRSIAKYINHKTIDPGILVMDEKGQFVISLLSGHMGRANEGAKYIEGLIGAKAVITTASDVKGVMAIDTLAMKIGCHIESLEDAKRITALMVNDEFVGIETEVKLNISLPKSILTKDQPTFEKIQGMVYISNKKYLDAQGPKVQLIPKNIAIGIGCKRGISYNRIMKAIRSGLEELNLHEKSIKVFATIDVKGNEEGILRAKDLLQVPLEIIPREEIKRVEGLFQTSDFVRRSIGIGAVCEPCGYLSSNHGNCLMGKRSYGGITLSIWEVQ